MIALKKRALALLLDCARHYRSLTLLFADEATVQLNPTLTRAWGLRGQQVRVRAWPGDRRKTHIFGAIDVVRGRVHHRLAPTINGGHFRRFLRHLLRHCPRGCIVVVADNAGWHKGRALQPWLARHRRLKLFFLPKYSPDMNPIEPLWKRLRREVSHNHFFGALPGLKRAVGTGLRRMNRDPRAIVALGSQYVNVH